MAKGYYTGVTDVYYAIMSTEDKTGSVPTYGEVKNMGNTVEITATPSYKEGEQYASNVAVMRKKEIDYYDVTLNMAQVDQDVRKDILGRSEDANGVQSVTGSQSAPYVAIGFAITMDDGTKEYWWMYKGKFSEVEVGASTETSAIEIKTVSFTAKFDRRISDDKVAVVADSGNSKSTTVCASWFDAVVEQAS